MSDIRLLPPIGLLSLSIAHLSGHSLCIHRVSPIDDLAGTPVPVKFRKQAFEAGCSVVGIDVEEEEAEGGTDKTGLIVAAIEAVVERNDTEEIEGDGRPSLKAVKAQAGFGVTKAELNAAWLIFEDSLA